MEPTMPIPKRYTENLILLVSQDQKADLEALAMDEQCSMASIVRRALQAELYHAKNRNKGLIS